MEIITIINQLDREKEKLVDEITDKQNRIKEIEMLVNNLKKLKKYICNCSCKNKEEKI